MNKALKGFFGALFGLAFFAGTTFAANGYTFFGEADYVSPGNGSMRAVETVSDADPGFGGIEFDVTPGMTFADLATLGTDFNVTDDNCTNGSPRFQVAVTDGTDSGNIFVYLGTAPSYNTCVPNTWTSSGDLLEGVNPIDTSQLDDGTFYDPYADALLRYGDYEVTEISLVTDAGYAFADGEQTVLFDNTNINGTVYNYEASQQELKDSCKKGGYQDYDGTGGVGPFKNQGQCVSYFNHQ